MLSVGVVFPLERPRELIGAQVVDVVVNKNNFPQLFIIFVLTRKTLQKYSLFLKYTNYFVSFLFFICTLAYFFVPLQRGKNGLTRNLSLGHFYKLIYGDFEVFVEEIAVRKFEAMRALWQIDNQQDADKKPKAYKNVNV